MVNTNRLERLLTDQEVDPALSRVANGGMRRSLAISGARDLRRTGTGRALNLRQLALVQAAWENLDVLTRATSVSKQDKQFNALARSPQIASLFDVLRAQLLTTFQRRNLRTLGVTSPVSGTGTSYTTAGLLASFARRSEGRVVGLDLNLANPAMHKFFEVASPGPISPMIYAETPIESHLRRATTNLAVGLGDDNASIPTLLEGRVFGEFMGDLVQLLAPDMIICDLPPLLEGDAALSLLSSIDAVLVVADGARTRASQIADCERIVQDQAEFLGVVLNRATPAWGA
jgi:protein-tyrosine kinase